MLHRPLLGAISLRQESCMFNWFCFFNCEIPLSDYPQLEHYLHSLVISLHLDLIDSVRLNSENNFVMLIKLLTHLMCIYMVFQNHTVFLLLLGKKISVYCYLFLPFWRLQAFQVMSFFATAEHERERLQYFASPEGRDDLYKYNQKERRTVLEVNSNWITS